MPSCSGLLIGSWALAGAQLYAPELEALGLSPLPELAALPGQPTELSDVWSSAEEKVVGPHTVCQDSVHQYSGRLPAGEGALYFFWLATARNVASEDAPLILWLTGGPGCASTLALVAENGPCTVGAGPAHNGTWPTERNPWSWSEAANVLWVDQPGGVGYSVGPPTPMEVDVGKHMVAFFKSFYRHFPKLQKQPLFVFGESYAGHYVPAVGWAMQQAEDPKVHVGGIAIGNGLVNPVPQFSKMAEMAYTGGKGGSLDGKGVLTHEQYETMKDTFPACRASILDCQANRTLPDGHQRCMNSFIACAMPTFGVIKGDLNKNMYDLRKPCIGTMCYDLDNPLAFLTDSGVQESLGVVPPPGNAWEFCNFTVQQRFILSGDWMARLDQIVINLLAKKVPVLVYSGDCDFSVNWLGSRAWMSELAWPHLEAWNAAPNEAYVVDGRDSGRVQSSHGLTFVQIYKAGHLVPMDKPAESLAMVKEFVRPSSTWSAIAEESLLAPVMTFVARPMVEATLGAGMALVAIGACVLAAITAAKRTTTRGPASKADKGAVREPLL